MIAFGCSITLPEVYELYAKPGLARAAEPDSDVLALQAAGSIFRSYNLMMDKASSLEDLEALVLVHQDAEIVDPDFCAKLRAALEDPEVAVVGCVGATGVRSIAWWEGSVTWSSMVRCYEDLRGTALAAPSANGDGRPAYAQVSTGEAPLGEVETVDGFLMALSPWTVRNVRFDEGLGRQVYGYDFDFCAQVRDAGRKVVAADLQAIHHRSSGFVADPEPWVQAYIRVAEKWEGRLPGGVGPAEEDWKQRGRRAEAQAAAARLLANSKQLQAHAGGEAHGRHLQAIAGSASWRLTEPLRRLNARRSGGDG